MIRDANQFTVRLHVEGKNKATLELGLNATLGVAGCQILDIEEYHPPEY